MNQNNHSPLNTNTFTVKGERSRITPAFINAKRWGELSFGSGEKRELDKKQANFHDTIVEGAGEKFIKRKKLIHTHENIGDGNIFSHSIKQASLIRKYAKHDMSPEDVFALRVLGLLHDIGETGSGDVIYDDKAFDKEVREKIEHETGNKIIDILIRPEFQEEAKGIYNINFDKEHRLHEDFLRYERLSYMWGAIRAHKNESMRASLIFGLNVFGNQLPKMLEDILNGYEGTLMFLRDNKEMIQEIIDNIFAHFSSTQEVIDYRNDTGVSVSDTWCENSYQKFQACLDSWEEIKTHF